MYKKQKIRNNHKSSKTYDDCYGPPQNKELTTKGINFKEINL